MKKRFTLALTIMSALAISAGCSSNEVVEKPINPVESVVDDQSTIKDQDIKPYGQLVDVKGKKMNVLDVGEGKETIVWIPGYGDIAPGLSYTKMLEELTPHYRVLVVEPFGYGLSDLTDDPRTIENITEEIHEAVQQIEGVDKYILMAHSISGVYGMQYVNDYRDEVTGFIGLDTSTPNMLDGMTMIIPPADVPPIPEVSDEVNEQYRNIGRKVNGNKNHIDEDERKGENFEKAKSYSFPADLPVAFFLAQESIDNQGLSPTEHKDWVKMHTDLTKDSSYTEVYAIDGHHLLYQDKYKEITEKLNEFLANRPTES
ncbi:MAG: alpha/beta hydrolase [Solibacillus sp.]